MFVQGGVKPPEADKLSTSRQRKAEEQLFFGIASLSEVKIHILVGKTLTKCRSLHLSSSCQWGKNSHL